jgi:hypothetical protein
MGKVGKVFQISRVGQFIDIDQGILRIGVQIITNEIAPNKTASPRHQYLHRFLQLLNRMAHSESESFLGFLGLLGFSG